jgi:hypothetical protein
MFLSKQAMDAHAVDFSAAFENKLVSRRSAKK